MDAWCLRLVRLHLLHLSFAAEALLPAVTCSDAIALLPKLTTGIDVNVRFHSITEGFEYTPETVRACSGLGAGNGRRASSRRGSCGWLHLLTCPLLPACLHQASAYLLALQLQTVFYLLPVL